MKNKKILFVIMTVFAFAGLLYAEEASENSWNDAGNKAYDFISGPLKITVNPRIGSYNFAILNSEGKYVPALSTKNEGATTTFYLKAGKKVYHLSSGSDVKVSYKKNPGGLVFKYDIKNIASVVTTFTPLKSSSGSDYDVIKISSEITNRNNRKQELALKTVLDTYLGESDRFHFYTSEGVNIKGENSYRSMKNEKWFLSKNSAAAMEILLYGADITPPEYVALASYSTLEANDWEPKVTGFRSFDTVLSYNNSGIGINWASVRMDPDSAVKTVFYISLAVDGRKPAGHKYIEAMQNPLAGDDKEDENSDDKKTEIQDENPEKTSITTDSGFDSAFTVPAAVNNGFSVKNVTKFQMSPEYIQALLDKIAELEEIDAVLNRDEIIKLNSELDVILEALRQ